MRSLGTAVKHIRRTPYQAIAISIVLTMIFFIAGIFAMVALGSHLILTHFETKPQVIAYLVDTADPAAVAPLKSQLESTGKVESAQFVSKEEALAIYKESVGNDPLLLGTVTELGVVTADVLPSSLEISVKNPDYFPEIVDILKASDLVATNANNQKDIDFPQDAVAELTAWTRALRTSGIGLILVQAFSSILVMVIAIGMKVSSRRSEIATMKLLGAKGGFIAWPYIFESILYSLWGALLGWLFAYTALLYATPFLAPRTAGIITLPLPLPAMLAFLGTQLAAAVILGFISGWLAVGRFTRRG